MLLHSSWKFNGMAGFAMLLTVGIVISGLIGRYIYIAVPRTAEGAEIEAAQLERQIEQVDSELQRLLAESPTETRSPLQRATLADGAAAGSSALIFGRGFDVLRFRWIWRRARRKLGSKVRARFAQTCEIAAYGMLAFQPL